jgi:hypothetical protein
LNFLKAFVHAVLRGLRFILKFLWHLERQNLNTCKAWKWAGSGKASGHVPTVLKTTQITALLVRGQHQIATNLAVVTNERHAMARVARRRAEEALFKTHWCLCQSLGDSQFSSWLLSIVRSASKGFLLGGELVHLLLPNGDYAVVSPAPVAMDHAVVQ